jgi:hypothetical protein
MGTKLLFGSQGLSVFFYFFIFCNKWMLYFHKYVFFWSFFFFSSPGFFSQSSFGIIILSLDLWLIQIQWGTLRGDH